MNWGDILVLAVLSLTVGAVIGKMYRDRKKGKSCGSCSGCSCSSCDCCGKQN